MDKLLISFSGGATSAYMTWWLFNEWPQRNIWEKVVVFANTGKERNETLDFVYECTRRWNFGTVWVEADVNPSRGTGTGFKIVNYDTASRNGEPFEDVIKKYGIPNTAYPHCTRELKQAPIHSYIKSYGWKKYWTAIGIRADEFDRMNPKRKELRYMYPLVDECIVKQDIAFFWARQSFNLKLKGYEGNCDLCWKKSAAKLDRLVRERPDLTEWWKQMEKKYGNFIPASRNQESKLPIRFYRGNRSIEDFVSAKSGPYTQTDLFEFGCGETCEPVQ